MPSVPTRVLPSTSMAGNQAYEFELMCRYGMTPAEALTAATKTGSELMRKSADIGSIEAGKYADIAAFDGDPMEDITAMTRCTFVMKGGEVYKKDGRALRQVRPFLEEIQPERQVPAF